MAENAWYMIAQNETGVNVVVLIVLFGSIIVLVRKKRYDAAISIVIATAAFVALTFLRAQQAQ